MASIYALLMAPNTGVCAGPDLWGLLGLRLGQSLSEVRSAFQGLDLAFVEVQAEIPDAVDFLWEDPEAPEELSGRAHMRLTFGHDGGLVDILATFLGDDGLAKRLTTNSSTNEVAAAIQEAARASSFRLNSGNRLTFDGIKSGLESLVTETGAIDWGQAQTDAGLNSLHHVFVRQADVCQGGEADKAGALANFAVAADFERAMVASRSAAQAAGLHQASIGVGVARLGDFVRPTLVLMIS